MGCGNMAILRQVHEGTGRHSGVCCLLLGRAEAVLLEKGGLGNTCKKAAWTWEVTLASLPAASLSPRPSSPELVRASGALQSNPSLCYSHRSK